jgi:hypothetical protein
VYYMEGMCEVMKSFPIVDVKRRPTHCGCVWMKSWIQ